MFTIGVMTTTEHERPSREKVSLLLWRENCRVFRFNDIVVLSSNVLTNWKTKQNDSTYFF